MYPSPVATGPGRFRAREGRTMMVRDMEKFRARERYWAGLRGIGVVCGAGTREDRIVAARLFRQGPLWSCWR